MKLRRGEMEQEDSGFHSHAYHRFYEGYRETMTVDAKGRNVIRREYIGKYYFLHGDTKQWHWSKVWSLVMYVLGMIFFLLSAYPAIDSNRNLVLNLIQTLCLSGEFYLGICIFRYVISERRMKIYEYRAGVVRKKVAAYIAAAGVLLHTVGKVVFVFLYGSKEIGSMVFSLMSVIICIGLAAGLRRQRFHEENNTAVIQKEDIIL